MNRTIAILLAVIIVLVAALAWTAGRNQGTQVDRADSETPASTADNEMDEAKPTPEGSAAATVSIDAPQTAGSGASAPTASKGQKSRFFDLANDSIVDAKCRVTVKGVPVIQGDCTVNTKDDRVIVFSNEDGCTIDINGVGSIGTAEMSSYRNPCPHLYKDEEDPIYQLPLGNVTRRGDCWINDKATVCASK